jgi:hypothetical protein
VISIALHQLLAKNVLLGIDSVMENATDKIQSVFNIQKMVNALSVLMDS